ncbi:hypothetical protein BD289DRAFT_433370 [Coniella lustricola]|uniref:Uncharacterized protein n=1 Tax=Coniella lustricola TaxID=2025994 RepID=A0A2T3A8N2_9PEZI|nr:hypothetical protein BD289DRAFT_433370 [Coniella lustricola]
MTTSAVRATHTLQTSASLGTGVVTTISTRTARSTNAVLSTIGTVTQTSPIILTMVVVMTEMTRRRTRRRTERMTRKTTTRATRTITAMVMMNIIPREMSRSG